MTWLAPVTKIATLEQGIRKLGDNIKPYIWYQIYCLVYLPYI